MKPIYKLYLKVFLLMGVFYAIINSLFDYFDGKDFHLWKFLIALFFFGTFMSIFLVSMQKKYLKKLGIKSIKDSHLKTIQSTKVFSNLKKESILNLLNEDEYYIKSRITTEGNVITIKTPMTMRSWGEVIKIKFNGINDELTIVSKPKLRTTFIDYSKNYENIINLKRILNDIA